MPAPVTRELFAEMYVAGALYDQKWSVYFPHRDEGFDLIATKKFSDGVQVRPVQVKGLYPTMGKTDKVSYGYTGTLTLVHPDMILALVYFDISSNAPSPRHIAWMPFNALKVNSKSGKYRCKPAQFKSGCATPRRDFAKYFDSDGLRGLEQLA